MQRINDNGLELIDMHIRLKDKKVLEIGCGNGSKSIALANRCAYLNAIDPSVQSITYAKEHNAADNLTYEVGSAEKLGFENHSFDVVYFALSFHHVPVNNMHQAIEEAIRVAKRRAKIVFLEPAFMGSFFEAEIRFGASDGDERAGKAAAYYQMLSSDALHEEAELFDEITLRFDSTTDFIESMEPKHHVDAISQYLVDCNYTVTAQRRINIFSVQ